MTNQASNLSANFQLEQKAGQYLRRLCLEIPTRRVGSPENREAARYFAERMASFGFQTECPEFDCIDWVHESALLTANGQEFRVFPSPYSLGCQVSGRLAVASTVEELAAVPDARAEGEVLLLRGEVAREQLMPKNFRFYNPEEHQRIIRLLETRGPQAILCATSRNPEMAGAVYPFPLIEDGDFDIPSVYMTDTDGDRLLAAVGQEVLLESRARRIPAKGCNVVGHKAGRLKDKLVFCAHFDAKQGSPGALDNASGVVILLLLAELLEDYSGEYSLEILAINGEDYYANPGEIQYLEMNQDRMGEILLAVNMDAVGYLRGQTAYSLYACPEDLAARLREVFSNHKEFLEGDPWYQSDHMVFAMNQVPAVAITSQFCMEILSEIAHTEKDRPELVEPARLVRIARALQDLTLRL
jgi:aminopeptidase YwaD